MNHSCRDTEWVKFAISQPPALTSEFEGVYVCVRETETDSFLEVECEGKPRVSPFLPNNRVGYT